MKQVGRLSWKVHLFALCLARDKVVYSFFLCIQSFQVKYFHRFLEPNTGSHSCKDWWVYITDTWVFFKKINQTKTKPTNQPTKTKPKTCLIAPCGFLLNSAPVEQDQNYQSLHRIVFSQSLWDFFFAFLLCTYPLVCMSGAFLFIFISI